MAAIRKLSDSDPIEDRDASWLLLRLVELMAAVGLGPGPRADMKLDLGLARRSLRVLAGHGIGTGAVPRMDLMRPERLRDVLSAACRSIEESPHPDTEWTRVLELWSPEELAAMLGASAPSVRRYASGERTTPDDVAERLHFIALVAGDLVGSYNAIGVRNWFRRPRPPLSGKDPARVFRGKWKPHDELPRKVRELARSLADASAT